MPPELLLLSACSVLLVGVHLLGVLPWLPEPKLTAGEIKIPYADLASRIDVVALMVVGIGCQFVTAAVPAEIRPMWLVFGSSVLVLVWIDLRTTWLPKLMTWLCWGEQALALGVGLTITDDPVALATATVLGGLGAGVFFWLVWRLTHGGIGYGDVRLAVLVGMVAGSLGSSMWWLSMLAGSMLGVFAGITIDLLRRRRAKHASGTPGSEFAYGPALWAGPYLGFAISVFI